MTGPRRRYAQAMPRSPGSPTSHIPGVWDACAVRENAERLAERLAELARTREIRARTPDERATFNGR
jgi:hypothetical protein